jgi:hypothetical protein
MKSNGHEEEHDHDEEHTDTFHCFINLSSGTLV